MKKCEKRKKSVENLRTVYFPLAFLPLQKYIWEKLDFVVVIVELCMVISSSLFSSLNFWDFSRMYMLLLQNDKGRMLQFSLGYFYVVKVMKKENLVLSMLLEEATKWTASNNQKIMIMQSTCEIKGYAMPYAMPHHTTLILCTVVFVVLL